MKARRRTRNTKRLWISAAIGCVYCAGVWLTRTLTGGHSLDGILGIVLGLFICAGPAANMVDILIYGRVLRNWDWTKPTDRWWMALNALVMIIGWFDIFVGTTRFVVSG